MYSRCIDKMQRSTTGVTHVQYQNLGRPHKKPACSFVDHSICHLLCYEYLCFEGSFVRTGKRDGASQRPEHMQPSCNPNPNPSSRVPTSCAAPPLHARERDMGSARGCNLTNCKTPTRPSRVREGWYMT